MRYKFIAVLIPIFLLAACGGSSPEQDLADIHSDDPSDGLVEAFSDHLDTLERSCPNDSRSDIAGYLENGHDHLVNEDGVDVSMLDFTSEAASQLGGVEWHEENCVNAVALVMMVFQD